MVCEIQYQARVLSSSSNTIPLKISHVDMCEKNKKQMQLSMTFFQKRKFKNQERKCLATAPVRDSKNFDGEQESLTNYKIHCNGMS